MRQNSQNLIALMHAKIRPVPSSAASPLLDLETTGKTGPRVATLRERTDVPRAAAEVAYLGSRACNGSTAAVLA
jgi:hypothetical protein